MKFIWNRISWIYSAFLSCVHFSNILWNSHVLPSQFYLFFCIFSWYGIPMVIHNFEIFSLKLRLHHVVCFPFFFSYFVIELIGFKRIAYIWLFLSFHMKYIRFTVASVSNDCSSRFFTVMCIVCSIFPLVIYHYLLWRMKA